MQYNAQIITDLKQAQETILDLKNHLKSVIESSPDMIICLDKGGLVELVNPVTERILHIPMHAMLGCKLTEVCQELEVFENDIESTIHERLPRTLLEETLPDGNVYNITVYPLAAGVPGGGVVFAAVDITEKKRMEVELIQAQKMETIGLLAGGFAHDFNNILMGITGNLSLLKMASDEAKRAKYIASMESISGRAKDLISQMLMFSKKKVGSPQQFSINKVMQDVMDMATKSISKNVSIELTKPEKDHDLFMDYTQLTQVMLNLIINARDAIGNRQDGLIKIGVQPILVDEALKRRYMLEKAGRYIKIDIIDNGCGIEKDNLTKIFDPFFTTKPKDVGTGLGLAITYNIIKHAEGSIQVTSEKDKGTRFSIILPVTDGVMEAEPEYAEIKTTGQRFRILLVDDEEMLREIGKEMLESLGHEVLTARNGFECIEMLKQEDGSIDLVILDMIMPGLDGQHTLVEMVKSEIQTKVMVSSGFYHEELSDNVMANSLVVAKLNKPFNMQELSRVLSSIF
jgi:PAS domain S-box-containing protein